MGYFGRAPDNYQTLARDELKKGGDPEKARTLSILAVAQAIDDFAAELASLGKEGHPIHTYEMRE